MTCTYALDGHVNPPRGVRGGTNGSPQQVWQLDENGERVDIDVIGAVDLQPGQAIVAMTSSGGGYGLPTERDPERVRDDVSEGWVSRERAASVYGVVVTEAADGTIVLDVAATNKLREETQQ